MRIRRLKHMSWISLLVLLCINGVVQAGWTVTVQPIIVRNTDGTGGETNSPTKFILETNKIWAQAEITIEFLAAHDFNNSMFLNIAGSGQPTIAQLAAATPGTIKSTDPNVINMWFLTSVAGAFGQASSSSIAISHSVFTFNAGNGRIDTIAHEIGHSLGLPHYVNAAESLGTQRAHLMRDGGDRNVPPTIGDITPDGANLSLLGAGEIATAQSSHFAIAVPEPSTLALAVVGIGMGIGMGWYGRRRVLARRVVC